MRTSIVQLEKKRRWLSLWRPLCSPQTHLPSFIKGINTHQRFYISKRNTEVWCPTPGSFLLLTELGAGGGRWKGSQGGRGPFSPRKMNHERSPHPHSSSSGWGTCQGIKPQAEVCDCAQTTTTDGWQQWAAGCRDAEDEGQTTEVSPSGHYLPGPQHSEQG